MKCSACAAQSIIAISGTKLLLLFPLAKIVQKICINFELDKNLIHTTNCHLLYQVAEHLDFAKFAIISDREGLSFGSELLKSCLCLYIMLFQKAKDLQFLVNTWNTTFSFSVMSPWDTSTRQALTPFLKTHLQHLSSAGLRLLYNRCKVELNRDSGAL